jgi:hypothetical protein
VKFNQVGIGPDNSLHYTKIEEDGGKAFNEFTVGKNAGTASCACGVS